MSPYQTGTPQLNLGSSLTITGDTLSIENRRYIGSKAKLLDWIFNIIGQECTGTSFADIFAGTGVVAGRAAKTFPNLIVNDLLYSNFLSHHAFFSKDEYDWNKIESIRDEYNSVDAEVLTSTHFSENFGGKYFDSISAKRIGYIRSNLFNRFVNTHELSNKEHSILLTSLLYSADRIANTVGHYEAFFKKEGRRGFEFKLIKPIYAESVDIYREDANKLVSKIQSDIVYIDPPYNSRQYSRFYHVLETLVQWDEPMLAGVALKRPEENMSEYCRNKASDAFADLISKINAKYIVVSYNNTYNSKSSSSRNKIELDEIKRILESKGRTTTHQKDHKFFNAGNTDFNNHQEWLFVTEVA